MSWVLHEDGIDLNGITLQSSILDYANAVRAGHVPDARGRCVLLEEDDAQPDADRPDAYMVQARNYADNTLAPLAQKPNRRTAAS